MAKVMLVEDDNNLREIYEARLQAEGYAIVSARDGEEALVVAKQEKPDLIISDVMMPKISGFEMLDILRNTDGLKEVKVIMLTALGQTDDKSRADKLGADRYLVKSQVTLEDIVKAAQELLGGGPAGAQTPAGEPTPATAQTPPPTPTATPTTPQPEPTAQPSTTNTPNTPPNAVPEPTIPVVAAPEVVPTPASTPPISPAEPPATTPTVPPAVAPTDGPTPPPAHSPLDLSATTQQSTSEPAEASNAASASSTSSPIATDEPVTPLPTAPPVAQQPQPQEQPSVESQIESFIGSQPPSAPATQNTNPVTPEPTTTTTPAPTPSPSNSQDQTTSTEDIQKADDQILSGAVNELVESANNNGQSPKTPSDIKAVEVPPSTDNVPPVTPPQATATQPEPAPEPAAPEEDKNSDQVKVAGKKIIQPINSEPKTDLNTLLAMEEAKEAAGSNPASGSSPVIQPSPPSAAPDPNDIAL